MLEKSPDRVERWPFSASVGLLLRNGREIGGGLILVTKKTDGRLGLIAGGVEKAETGIEAIGREADEEAGLKPEDLFIDTLVRPEIVFVPNKLNTSIGVVYRGFTVRRIPENGYKPESGEVDWIKPYSVEELFELANQPDRLYRPEFNLLVIRKWLVEELTRLVLTESARSGPTRL
jgi:8-oxo-dGTP pyrophosphatase MutT (NUDIX family)